MTHLYTALFLDSSLDRDTVLRRIQSALQGTADGWYVDSGPLFAGVSPNSYRKGLIDLPPNEAHFEYPWLVEIEPRDGELSDIDRYVAATIELIDAFVADQATTGLVVSSTLGARIPRPERFRRSRAG